MPSKKQYNLVSDDAYDSRIPLYNEEAFQHGITFHAKYIGSLDVPRPGSRVEIVAAMRRIRYEFKAKSMKKKKVSITVSVDGVKVVLRSKRKANQWPWDENKYVVMHHPIYRIFYVSHDSQDLKIFSYIARDGGTNAFKCNVFKSKKKSQAMRIVRTVGQAFEVCHKLSLALATSTACSIVHEDIEENQLTDPSQKGKCQGDGASEPNSCDTQAEEAVTSKSQDFIARSPSPLTLDNNEMMKKVYNEAEKNYNTLPNETQVAEGASLSLYHHIQLLREQLEQQNQQMQAVVGQVQLLRNQLAAETAARLEAQAQNHHLLAHNRELLEHIRNLVKHIHEVETKFHISGKEDNSFLPPEPSSLPQMSSTSDLTSSSFLGPLLQSDCMKTASSANTFGRSVPEGVATAVSHEQFLDSFLQKIAPNSFGRQLSVPSVTVPSSSGSPRLGAVARDPFLTGLSLPGSPSQRSFTSDTELLFKQQTPVNNSPKLPRTQVTSSKAADDILNSFLNVQGNDNSLLEQPATCFPSVSSPRHQKSKGDRTQTVDILSNSHTITSLFHDDDHKTKFSVEEETLLHHPAHQNSIPLSKFSSVYERSVQHPANEESFIAQVTRDIANMNVIGRESAIGTYESHSDSSFPSLFKS